MKTLIIFIIIILLIITFLYYNTTPPLCIDMKSRDIMFAQAVSWNPMMLLVAAVLVEIILICFQPQIGITVFLTFCWYILLSGADWALHRFVLHANNSPVPTWRNAHRMHHLEFEDDIGYTYASLTFSHKDTLLIALTTLPLTILIWIIAKMTLTSCPPFWVFCIVHISMIILGVGIHNYAHSVFHGYEPPSWDKAPCIKIPKAVCDLLHEHHQKHHKDPGLNYCTVFLGFDWLVGSKAYCEYLGLKPHRMFSHTTKTSLTGLTTA